MTAASAAAAKVAKGRLIAGVWSAIGGAAGYSVYRNIRDFEDNNPCVRDAVRVLATSSTARATLGNGELLVARWPRSGAVDRASGLARASFEVRGDAGSAYVVAGARRRAKNSGSQLETLGEEDDEDTLDSGWRQYLSRPWELKALIVGKFRGSGSQKDGSGSDEEEQPWDIDSLFFLPGGDVHSPTVLLGDARGLPEYEALCMNRDAEAKSERSQRRLRIVMGIALMGAVFAGGARLAKSVKVSQSYGFVRRSLIAHEEVTAALGPGAVVQTSSGTFGARFINARLRLVGQRGAVADVDVAATRDSGGGSPWRVALARMELGGLTYNLDRSKFC